MNNRAHNHGGRTGSLFHIAAVLFMLAAVHVAAADGRVSTNQAALGASPNPLADVLLPGRWQQVEQSVDRALAWLATQQESGGSFPTSPQAEPGVTSLCVLAFLSRGHQPGAGPYGQRLNRAIDFVLGCQQPDGMLSASQGSQPAVYNHAMAGTMLGEAYGQISGERSRQAKAAIEKALRFTRQLQLRSKRADEKGGWRYLRPSSGNDSDLSVTSWQLMFLRSAKNAEFEVPEAAITEAMAYVRRCWDRQGGGFHYFTHGENTGSEGGRGLAGAGIVSLSLGGQHQTVMAQSAGDWLLAHPFRGYGETIGQHDRFIYSTYYCSQGMAQLGGRHWKGFFPQLVSVLLGAQERDGSWPSESNLAQYGDALTTAFAVLSLTPPYQLLPIYQR